MASYAFTWILPYSPDDSQGGWKAMQFHLLRALEQRLGAATRIAPVEVAEEFVGKWTSRFQKQLHVPRRYAYYSESRLAAFAQVVESKLPSSGSQPVIFFGALPFVKCRPATPYFINTDGASSFITGNTIRTIPMPKKTSNASALPKRSSCAERQASGVHPNG